MAKHLRVELQKLHIITGKEYGDWLYDHAPTNTDPKERPQANPDSLEESAGYYSVTNPEVVARTRKVIRKMELVLTAKQQKVFSAVVFENKSLREIARENGLAYASVHETWEACRKKFIYYYKRFQ